MGLKMNPLETLYIDIDILLIVMSVIVAMSIVVNVMLINVVYLLNWIFKLRFSDDIKVILFGLLTVQLNIYIVIDWVSYF